jgi:hypothetical protein
MKCNITKAREISNYLAYLTLFNGILIDFDTSSNSNEVKAFIYLPVLVPVISYRFDLIETLYANQAKFAQVLII